MKVEHRSDTGARIRESRIEENETHSSFSRREYGHGDREYGHGDPNHGMTGQYRCSHDRDLTVVIGPVCSPSTLLPTGHCKASESGISSPCCRNRVVPNDTLCRYIPCRAD